MLIKYCSWSKSQNTITKQIKIGWPEWLVISEDFENSILWIANLDLSPGFITDWFFVMLLYLWALVGVSGILLHSTLTAHDSIYLTCCWSLIKDFYFKSQIILLILIERVPYLGLYTKPFMWIIPFKHHVILWARFYY